MSEEDERRHLIDEFGEQAVDRIEDFARRAARATSTPISPPRDPSNPADWGGGTIRPARATSTPAGLDRDSLIALIEKHCDIGDYGNGASDPEGLADAILARATSTPAGLDVDLLALALMNTMPDVLDWEMHVAAEYARLAALQGADR